MLSNTESEKIWIMKNKVKMHGIKKWLLKLQNRAIINKRNGIVEKYNTLNVIKNAIKEMKTMRTEYIIGIESMQIKPKCIQFLL